MAELEKNFRIETKVLLSRKQHPFFKELGRRLVPRIFKI
jgi:hypothetical protein